MFIIYCNQKRKSTLYEWKINKTHESQNVREIVCASIQIGIDIYLNDTYSSYVAHRIPHIIYLQPQIISCQTVSLKQISKTPASHTICIAPNVSNKNIIHIIKGTCWRWIVTNYNKLIGPLSPFNEWHQKNNTCPKFSNLPLESYFSLSFV